MSTCVNCDYQTATARCVDCPQGQNVYCKECSQLHCKVKQYRSHTLENFEASQTCNNCDKAEATMHCTTCPSAESALCNECYQFHKQVKKFRDHHVVPFQSKRKAQPPGSRFPENPMIKMMNEVLDSLRDYYLVVSEYVIENGLLKPSLAALVVIMLVVFLFLRMYIGRNAVVGVLILLIISIRYYIQFGQRELRASLSPESVEELIPPKIPSIQAAAALSTSASAPSRKGGKIRNSYNNNRKNIEFSDEVEIPEHEFADEFWHSRGSSASSASSSSSNRYDVNMFGGGMGMGGGGGNSGFTAPQFKPRTRLYVRRSHHNQHSALSPSQHKHQQQQQELEAAGPRHQEQDVSVDILRRRKNHASSSTSSRSAFGDQDET